jgi:hypothetical protein
MFRSGKTFTMAGIQQQAACDIFELLRDQPLEVYVSFFEIYGGRCQVRDGFDAGGRGRAGMMMMMMMTMGGDRLAVGRTC